MKTKMKLNDFLYKINKPCVFKNILQHENGSSKNSSLTWTPQALSEILNNIKLDFRLGKNVFNNENIEDVQFENKCDYVEATIKDFLEWLNNGTTTNGFSRFNRNDYWAYCDYKYMFELFDDENLKQCIDWSAFGFDERNAKDSTLWLGTQNAYTPCHYDTYGYNLVCQIYGRKRWILFSKNDTQFMSPKRVPFEESTVYSEINIKLPDLIKHPQFKHCRPYVVDLEPGDVLYVPHEWWHFVECTSLSISINTWCDMESDNQSRLNEILCKTLIQCLMESNFITYETWLNTSESFTTSDENLETIKTCLNSIKTASNINGREEMEIDYEDLLRTHKNFIKFIDSCDFQYYLNNYTNYEHQNKIQTTTTPTTRKMMTTEMETMDNKDKNFDILFRLSKALTNPKTIELISSILISEEIDS